MSRILLCALLLGALSFGAAADEPATVHAAAPDQATSGPTRVDAAAQDFEKTAQAFAGHRIPRMVHTDLAYPKDPAEFKAMDGFGMMVVAVVAQDKDELPPKRLYAMVGGKPVELQLALGSFAKSSGSPLVQKTIGPYRWNGLYYYPVYLSAEAQQLLMDFAKDRSGFALDLPKDLPAYLKSPIPPPQGSAPPTPAAYALLMREYPGMFAPADQH